MSDSTPTPSISWSSHLVGCFKAQLIVGNVCELDIGITFGNDS